MPLYTAAIEVRKMYHVEIQADDEADLESKANAMPSTEVEREGNLTNVETAFIEVEDEEDDDDS